jgi:sialidase-1
MQEPWLRRLLGHLRPAGCAAATAEQPSSPDGSSSAGGAITLRESNVVFRGEADHPHLRSGHFPSVVEVAPGRLVATFTAGFAMGSPDVRCYWTESLDGARGWSTPQKIWEPDESSRRYSTGIRMSRAPDGSLVGFVNQLDFGAVGEPPGPSTNTATGGSVPKVHGVIRSEDGRRWSQPEFSPAAWAAMDWHCFGEPSPILALSADKWLLPSLTRTNWEGEPPSGGLKSFVWVSHDQGETWSQTVDVFDMWSGRPTAEKVITYEQKQCVLSDGRILAMTWALYEESGANLPVQYTFSSDDGDSYGPPLASPILGQTCAPLALPEGRVLCVYRAAPDSGRRGLWVQLAKIEGEAWVTHEELCLWGSDREAMPGAKTSLIQEQLALQFGFPQLIRLSDGDVLVTFWGHEGEGEGISLIRSFRLGLAL